MKIETLMRESYQLWLDTEARLRTTCMEMSPMYPAPEMAAFTAEDAATQVLEKLNDEQLAHLVAAEFLKIHDFGKFIDSVTANMSFTRRKFALWFLSHELVEYIKAQCGGRRAYDDIIQRRMVMAASIAA